MDNEIFGMSLPENDAIDLEDLRFAGLTPEGFVLESDSRISVLNMDTQSFNRSFEVPFDDYHLADGPPVDSIVSRDNRALVFDDIATGKSQRFDAGSNGLPSNVRVGKKHRDTIIIGSTSGYFMSRNNGRTFSRLDDTIDLPSGFRIEGIAAIEQDSIVLRLLGRPANPNFVWMTGFGNLSDRPDTDGSELVMEVNDEIYYSDNSGSDMNLVPRPLSRSRVQSLGFDDGVITVALNDDAVYSSSNYGGRTWTHTDLDSAVYD